MLFLLSAVKCFFRKDRIIFKRLPYFLTGLVVSLVYGICFWIGASMAESHSGFIEAMGILVMLMAMVLGVLCQWSISLRRAHDLNHGWPILLLQFIPIVDFFFWLYLLFAPGTAGDNKFGPKPR